MNEMLESLEPLFLAASQRSGRPWPTDPYLRAHARAVFALAQAKHLAEEREELIQELRAVHTHLQIEAQERTDLIDDWCTVALHLVNLAAEIREEPYDDAETGTEARF